MKIERQQVGTVDVFTPVGALVGQEAESFSHLLLEQVTLPNPRIVVEMCEVPYLDSEAVEGLLDATEELANRATNLKLANVAQTCREIFELTGVSRRFSFFEDMHDAVRSFL